MKESSDRVMSDWRCERTVLPQGILRFNPSKRYTTAQKLTSRHHNVLPFGSAAVRNSIKCRQHIRTKISRIRAAELSSKVCPLQEVSLAGSEGTTDAKSKMVKAARGSRRTPRPFAEQQLYLKAESSPSMPVR